ncbi:tRNA pseudouridine(38-40) synthase TruA [soil metagenome]
MSPNDANPPCAGPTRRVKLTIAYDGRPFSGWQIQAGRPTVQEAIETAIARVGGGCRMAVHGSGRTDAGVHALGQVAHFDPLPQSSLPPSTWMRALNANLPPTIRILSAEAAAPDFHARFDATGKSYTYRIVSGPVLPPLEFGLAWHLPHPIDLPALRDALSSVVGTHDFRAFAANRGDASDHRSALRTIRQAEAVAGELPGTPPGTTLLTLTIAGDGFLYKMVRLLVGSEVRVAQGRATPRWMTSLLDGRGDQKSPYCAPPDGLSLTRVDYR